MRGMYHQQTKNILQSYSPKKPGFFQGHEERRLTWGFARQALLSRSPQERVAFMLKLLFHPAGVPFPTISSGPVTDQKSGSEGI